MLDFKLKTDSAKDLETCAKKSILDIILESRNGHYCHALEVSAVYELESAVEAIYSEFEYTHTVLEVASFFNSMSIYYIGDNALESDLVASFDFVAYLEEIY